MDAKMLQPSGQHRLSDCLSFLGTMVLLSCQHALPKRLVAAGGRVQHQTNPFAALALLGTKATKSRHRNQKRRNQPVRPAKPRPSRICSSCCSDTPPQCVMEGDEASVKHGALVAARHLTTALGAQLLQRQGPHAQNLSSHCRSMFTRHSTMGD